MQMEQNSKEKMTHHPHLPPHYPSRSNPSIKTKTLYTKSLSPPYEGETSLPINSLQFPLTRFHGTPHYRTVCRVQTTSLESQAKESSEATLLMGSNQEPTHLQAGRRVQNPRPFQGWRRPRWRRASRLGQAGVVQLHMQL